MTVLSYSSIAAQIPVTTGKLYLAYSGGIDSHVLLHLCATQAHLQRRIVAVYVNHGLQAAADAWAGHCRSQAQALDVDYLCLTVDAKASTGESPEAAARHARYQALRDLLRPDDLLLLAQHREDQMETVLLQLFRGAGIQGLAAMPARADFGRGALSRPLLAIAKAAIQDYARQHNLQWVEDPSNQSSDFDRNFLRNEILPLLKQRWPALDKTVSRSARHCGEAMDVLRAWSGEALQVLHDARNQALRIDHLNTFNPQQRRWLLREWLARFKLQPPSEAILQSIERQLVAGREGTHAQINLQGRVLTKYRQHLYCLPPQAFMPITADQCWQNNTAAIECANGYRIRLVPGKAGIPETLWRSAMPMLRRRSGGERLALPGRGGHHALKKLYQEAGIPPWERQARPLLYLNGRLAGVPGLWIDEWAFSTQHEACYRLIWEYADADVLSTPNGA